MMMNKTRRIYQGRIISSVGKLSAHHHDHHHPHNLLFWIIFSSPKSVFSMTNWKMLTLAEDLLQHQSHTSWLIVKYINLHHRQIYQSSLQAGYSWAPRNWQRSHLRCRKARVRANLISQFVVSCKNVQIMSFRFNIDKNTNLLRICLKSCRGIFSFRNPCLVKAGTWLFWNRVRFWVEKSGEKSSEKSKVKAGTWFF